MTTYDPNDPRLTAFALGELSGSDLAEIEELLANSDVARAELAEIQETIGLLQSDLAAEPTPALTAEQRQRLEQQLNSSVQPVLVMPQRDRPFSDEYDQQPAQRGAWMAVAGSVAACAVAAAMILPVMQSAKEATRNVAVREDVMHDGESLTVAAATLNEGALGGGIGSIGGGGIGGGEAQVADESGHAPAGALVFDALTSAPSGPANNEALARKQMPLRSRVAFNNPVSAPADARSFKATVADHPSAATPSSAQAPFDAAGSVGSGGKTVSLDASKRESGAAPSSGLQKSASLSRDLQERELMASTKTASTKSLEKESGPTPLKAAVVSAAEVAGQKADSAAPTPTEPTSDSKAKVSEATRLAMKSPQAANESKPTAESVESRRLAYRGVQLETADKAPGSLRKLADQSETKTLAEIDEKVVTRAKQTLRYGFTDSEVRKEAELSEAKDRQQQQQRTSEDENYEAVAENQFATPVEQPLSTFSIDVDSASFANARRFLTQGQLPPANAVRVEEFVNYFRYDYKQPADGEAFSVTADVAPCPWQREHYLARVGLKAKDIDKAKRPPTNLVFLIDVSGSMQPANKLPLVKRALTLLVEEMGANDHISIVTYAGNAGVKLPATNGAEQLQIMQAIEALNAGGSTNGASGISLAYEQALRHFNKEGENRVILCTDGDFNVGISNDNDLVNLIQAQAKSNVFLSVFGFGMGNLKDAKLEKLADKGNGHYGYIDDLNEARKVFNEELVGTLYTVAKDVKLQVEFNPLTVGAYRLIGYENRALAAQDFNDDTKDAGEIGAGHTVTALYEIVPAANWPKAGKVDDLKYASETKEQAAKLREAAKAKLPADVADDLLTVKLRYKQPTETTSVRTVDVVVDDIAGKSDIVPNRDLMWAASVANFAMHLKHSKHAGTWTLDDIAETAAGAKGDDPTGRKSEFVDMVKAAQRLGLK